MYIIEFDHENIISIALFDRLLLASFLSVLKVSCTWEDVHQMLSDSPKVHSSHAIQIRRKLLQASVALQVFSMNNILVSFVVSLVGSFN